MNSASTKRALRRAASSWTAMFLMRVMICCASFPVAAFGRFAPGGADSLRCVGKAALQRVVSGRKVGERAGALRPMSSPSGKYVMLFDCDTTRRGYAADSAVMRAFLAADTLPPRQLWSQRFNPHEVDVALTDRYARLAISITRGKDNKEYFMTQFIRLADGQLLSNMPMYAAYVNDSLDVAVGYESKYSSTLVAYRISDGSLLWKNEMTGMPVCRWEDVVPYEGGAKFAVLLDRLYSVDVNTGKVLNGQGYVPTVPRMPLGCSASTWAA